VTDGWDTDFCTTSDTVLVLFENVSSLKSSGMFVRPMMVCIPAVAVHVPDPVGPLLAVYVVDVPGASGAVATVHAAFVAPTKKVVTNPDGATAPPTFSMVAENLTAWPLMGRAGFALTDFTTRSGSGSTDARYWIGELVRGPGQAAQQQWLDGLPGWRATVTIADVTTPARRSKPATALLERRNRR
jgi:hypothetical protein